MQCEWLNVPEDLPGSLFSSALKAKMKLGPVLTGAVDHVKELSVSK